MKKKMRQLIYSLLNRKLILIIMIVLLNLDSLMNNEDFVKANFIKFLQKQDNEET